jgi:hypothetical protein
MSDYDVLNLSFSPGKAGEIEALHPLQLVAGAKSYVFYATKEKAEEVIRKFIDEPLLVDELPRPESDIVKDYEDLTPILPALFHAVPDEEKSKSQQLAEKLS